MSCLLQMGFHYKAVKAADKMLWILAAPQLTVEAHEARVMMGEEALLDENNAAVSLLLGKCYDLVLHSALLISNIDNQELRCEPS